MREGQENSKRLLRFVMFAVFAWGSILALGAGLFGIRAGQGGVGFAPNPLRGGVVFGCVAVFLAVWWLALRARTHQTRARRDGR